jgi:hypothetical protein
MSHHSRAQNAYFRASVQVDAIFSGAVEACIMDQIGSMDIINQMPKPTTAGDRRSIRRAYQTCFTWLARPRDSQKLLELSQAQCVCGSGASLGSSHQTGLEVMKRLRSPSLKPFFVLAEQILRLFCSNLDTKPRIGGRETHRRLHRLLHSQNWPGTWQEMVPHGSKDTLLTLHSLLVIDSPTTLRYWTMIAIGRIVWNCHALVIPVFICSPSIMVYGIAKSVRECQQILVEQISSGTPDFEVLCDVQSCLASIAEFFHGLFGFSHETQRAIFHAEGGDPLLNVYIDGVLLCRMLTEMNHFPSSQPFIAQSSCILDKFVFLGSWIYDDWPDSRKKDTEAALVELFDKQSIRHFPPKTDTFFRLLRLLHYLDVRQQCAAPGCSYTLVNGPLWQCAGCIRVTYCSRACQKRAWRHDIPHRSVCSVLAELQKELQLPHHDVYHFDVPGELVNSSWPPLANIALDHFARLVKYNMELLGELAITRNHPDLNVPSKVDSNEKNAQPTVDGGLEK